MATPDDTKKDHRALERRKNPPSSPSAKPGTAPPPEQAPPALRCPRCDSSNTKFCYYNNYSLTQPRHFCKTCRRYWTKGGALRNVPIGGGCRKSKKLRSSSSRGLPTGFNSKMDSSTGTGAAASPASSADVPSGFRFFPAGLSPAMDFQLAGLPSFHRLPIPAFSSFPNTPNPNTPRFSLEPPVGFGTGYPSLPSSSSSSPSSIASGLLFGSPTTQEMAGSSMNIQSSLASSIESLSSLNQDLHWKLQQQRLSMLFGPPSESSTSQKDDAATAFLVPATSSLALDAPAVLKPQPVPFQNQEFIPVNSSSSDNIYSRKDQGETAPTEWFFGNSYSSLIPDSTEDSSNGNGNGSVQAWGHSNLHHFGSDLP